MATLAEQAQALQEINKRVAGGYQLSREEQALFNQLKQQFEQGVQANPAEAQTLMQQMQQPQALPPASNAPVESQRSSLSRYGSLALEAPARAVTSIAGMPATLANAYQNTVYKLTQLIGLPLAPPAQLPGTTEDIRGAIEKIPGIEFTRPQTTGERYFSAATEQAAGGVLGAGILGRAGVPSMQALPARQLVTEGVAGAGQGVAGQAGQDIGLPNVPYVGPVLQLGLELVGATGGYNADRAARALARVGMSRADIVDILKSINPKTFTERMLFGATPEESVDTWMLNQLRREGKEQVAERLRTAVARQEHVPGYNPDLGTATEAEGILQAYKTQKGPPEFQQSLEDVRSRREVLAEQMQGKVEETARLPAESSAADVAATGQERLDRTLSGIEQEATGRTAALEQQKLDVAAQTRQQLREQRARIPAAQADVDAARQAAELRTARIGKRVDREVAKAEQAAKELIPETSGAVPEQAGTKTREAWVNAERAYYDHYNQEYAKFRDPSIRGEVNSLQKTLSDLKLSAEADGRPGNFPVEAQRDFENLVKARATQEVQATGQGDVPQNPYADATLSDLMKFRTLALEWQRANGATRQSRQTVEAIQDAMTHVASQSGNPGLTQELAAVGNAYGRDHMKIYNGVGEEILARDPTGYPQTINGITRTYKVAPSDVMEKLFGTKDLKGATENIRQLKQVVGTDTDAIAAAETYAAHSLYLSLQGKKLTQGALDRWKAQHAETLRALDEAGMPQVQEKFAQLADAQARVDEVIASGKSLQAALEDPARNRRLRDVAAKQQALKETREDVALQRERINVEKGEQNRAIDAETKEVLEAKKNNEIEALKRHAASRGDKEITPEKIREMLYADDPDQLLRNTKQVYENNARGDTQAEEAVRRQLVQGIYKRASTKGDLNAREFQRLMKIHDKALDAAGFTEDQKNLINLYADMQRQAQKPGIPSEAPTAKTEVENLFHTDRLAQRFQQSGSQLGYILGAMTYRNVFSSMKAGTPANLGGMVMGGVTGKAILGPVSKILGATVGGHYDRQVAKAFDTAIVNPDLASTLWKLENAKEITPELVTRLHSHLVMLGAGNRTTDDETR